MGNAWVNPSISYSTGKCNKTLRMGWNWEIGTHTFHILWVIFPHAFPIVQKNATKLIVWGVPGKLVLILYPYYGRFFPIRFPFYGILHHMGNACVFLLISHNMGKDSQTHRMGKVWEIGSRIYPSKPFACGEPGKLVLILFP